MGTLQAPELKHIENLCRNVKNYVFNAKPKKKNCPRAILKEPDNNFAKGRFWCLVTSRSVVVVVVVAAQALEQYFFTLRCMKSYISIKKNFQIALFLSFLSFLFKWCYFCCRITLLLF